MKIKHKIIEIIFVSLLTIILATCIMTLVYAVIIIVSRQFFGIWSNLLGFTFFISTLLGVMYIGIKRTEKEDKK